MTKETLVVFFALIHAGPFFCSLICINTNLRENPKLFYLLPLPLKRKSFYYFLSWFTCSILRSLSSHNRVGPLGQTIKSFATSSIYKILFPISWWTRNTLLLWQRIPITYLTEPKKKKILPHQRIHFLSDQGNSKVT